MILLMISVISVLCYGFQRLLGIWLPTQRQSRLNEELTIFFSPQQPRPFIDADHLFTDLSAKPKIHFRTSRTNHNRPSATPVNTTMTIHGVDVGV
jgi:hypothetical protein